MAAWYRTHQNLFQLIGEALPELLDRVRSYNDEHRWSQVRKSLRLISDVYKTQMHDNEIRIDWRFPVFQCAYVFLYFVKHSHLVYEAMSYNHHHFEPVWRQLRDIQVCSIGGGPGSDIAGVIAFLEGTTFGVALQCSVLDLYPQWEYSWNAIFRNLPSRLSRIDVGYHRFNLLDINSLTVDNLHRINTADLITFVKSFSTVSTESSVYCRVLPLIMKVIKQGGFVLFIDNSAADSHNKIFMRIALECGLRVLHEKVHDTVCHFVLQEI